MLFLLIFVAVETGACLFFCLSLYLRFRGLEIRKPDNPTPMEIAEMGKEQRLKMNRTRYRALEAIRKYNEGR